jgi:hypothetical protein
VEKYRRAGHSTDYNVMRRMRIARWIPKATNTHSEHVIFTTFPLQQCLQEGAPVSRLHRPTVLVSEQPQITDIALKLCLRRISS